MTAIASQLPLYRQLEQKLRGEIKAGRFGPNGKLPDERQLAAELGLSRTTIRLALKGLEESNMVRRVQGSGTYANPAPEPPARERAADRICLLTLGEACRYHQFVLAVMVEAQSSARQVECGLYVENCADIEQARQLMLQIQADPAVRGGILTGMISARDAEILAAQARIPWVVIGEFADSSKRQVAIIDQVVGDDFHRAKLASQYLVSKGCVKPALFLSDEKRPWSRDVAGAYRMVMDDAGIAPEDQQVWDVWVDKPATPRTGEADRYHTFQAVQKAIEYWDVSGRWPDGIVTTSDEVFDLLDASLSRNPKMKERLGGVIVAGCESEEVHLTRQRFPEFSHTAWFLTSIREMTDMAIEYLREPFPRSRAAVRGYARMVRCLEPGGQPAASAADPKEQESIGENGP